MEQQANRALRFRKQIFDDYVTLLELKKQYAKKHGGEGSMGYDPQVVVEVYRPPFLNILAVLHLGSYTSKVATFLAALAKDTRKSSQTFVPRILTEDYGWSVLLVGVEEEELPSLLRNIKVPKYYSQMAASKALKLTINYENDSQRSACFFQGTPPPAGEEMLDMDYMKMEVDKDLVLRGYKEVPDFEDTSESSAYVGTFLWEFGNPPTFEAPSRTEEEEQNCKPFSHLFLHLPAIVNAPPLPTPNHSKMKWSVHLMLVVCWRKKKKKKK
eukprot:Platyproteum_vivax@DN7658_c0_g3_i1.p1